MRFLADESCDFAIVRALREAGFDVTTVSESCPGAVDQVVIDLAIQDERMVLTEDKDFGRLVYADRRAKGGVLLLRFPATARTMMARSAVALVNERGEQLAGRFVVLQPGRVRIGGLPGNA